VLRLIRSRNSLAVLVAAPALTLVLLPDAALPTPTPVHPPGLYIGAPAGVMLAPRALAERKAAARRRHRARAPAAAGAPCPHPEPSPECNMTYHEGGVMHSNETVVVNWEPFGSTVSANYHLLTNQFLRDIATDNGRSTNPFSTDLQYYDSSGKIESRSTFAGSVTVTDPFPRQVEGCQVPAQHFNCLTNSQLVEELDAFLTRQHLPRENRIYFLLLPENVNTCVDNFKACGPYTEGEPGNAYCAYHSSFNLGHGTTFWANMPYGGVCANKVPSYPNEAPADGLIDVLSHEMNETITDPQAVQFPSGWVGGWFDATPSNGENGDKCNFKFGPEVGKTSSGVPYDVLINHRPYEIQEEWSNAITGCAMRTSNHAPTALWTAHPNPSVENHPVSFDASASHSNEVGGYLINYAWNFGDNSPVFESSKPTAPHTYREHGTYTVSLTVTDDAGRKETFTSTESVNFNTNTAWGGNGSGQLGDGSIINRNAPVTIEHLEERKVLINPYVAQLAGGNEHTLALFSNGEVKAWGDNRAGQLGTGSSATNSTTPTAIGSLSKAVAVAAGYEHSLALLKDGTVTAWGANGAGQLGNGTETPSSVPVKVPGLSGVVAIAAGFADSFALLKDGTVMAWGSNTAGDLGDGTFGGESCGGAACSRSPVPVSGLTGVAAIAAGGYHALALLANGQVKAWGMNNVGELGNGTETDSDVPVSVVEIKRFREEPITGITAVAAGLYHSLALQENGQILAWGGNEEGQLGVGTQGPSEHSVYPLFVEHLSSVFGIAAGCKHSIAVAGSEEVATWGSGTFGQLGNGTTTNSPRPVAVEGSRDRAATAGCDFSLAYRAPRPEVTSISPASGPPAGGNTVTISGPGLAAASSVRFGQTPAQGWEIISPESITATAPPGSSTVDVTVTGPGGRSGTTSLDRYRYANVPSVSGLEPASGPESGGTSVTIRGANLTGASEVRFGLAAAASFAVNSASSITAVAPPGSGTVDVTVITPEGGSRATEADHFTYVLPPAVTKIEPGSGPEAGATSVVITGTNLTSATTVKFGSANAASFKVNSETSVTAISPTGKGNVDLTVTTVGGTTATGPTDVFSYLPPPTVKKVAPKKGHSIGGTTVTIVGTNLGGATAVSFGTTKATSFKVSSPSSITAVSPAHAKGTVDVTATTPGGVSAIVAKDHFKYVR
jgi:alpha-tubulin suppressor-like RCC1 family protein